MPLVKRSPLPPGRYWIDVVKSKYRAFESMLGANTDKVRVTDYKPGVNDAVRTYVFTVTKDLPWDGPKWGWPSDAAGVTTAASTAQAPGFSWTNELQAHDFTAALSDLLSDAKTMLLVAGLIYLATRKGSR